MKNIYFDNAATTMVDPLVFEAMKPFFYQKYGNPSEYHRLGREGKKNLEHSRNVIASFLGAGDSEIVFTGSATESINLAIKGLIDAIKSENKGILNIVTSSIEHKAVLESCRHLENSGMATVTYLKVDRHGRIDLKELLKAIKKETVLVSIMYVNNEVGTVQEIGKIGSLIRKIKKNRKTRIYFHTDATQAIYYQNCNVRKLKVDLLSFSGHKINGPKGIGVLYLKKDTPIYRQIDGGGQEMGFRSGTENVANIVGLGRAVELVEKRKKEEEKTKLLLECLIKGVLEIPDVRLTGHPKKRSPHIASFLVGGVEGESLVLKLSDKGIYASSGSACTASDLNPSHVLTAMGFLDEDVHGSIRFSLGHNSKKEEIDYLIKILPKIILNIRKMSPL